MSELEYELNRVYGNDENTRRTILLLIKQELAKQLNLNNDSVLNVNTGGGTNSGHSNINKEIKENEASSLKENSSNTQTMSSTTHYSYGGRTYDVNSEVNNF